MCRQERVTPCALKYQAEITQSERNEIVLCTKITPLSVGTLFFGVSCEQEKFGGSNFREFLQISYNPRQKPLGLNWAKLSWSRQHHGPFEATKETKIVKFNKKHPFFILQISNFTKSFLHNSTSNSILSKTYHFRISSAISSTISNGTKYSSKLVVVKQNFIFKCRVQKYKIWKI